MLLCLAATTARVRRKRRIVNKLVATTKIKKRNVSETSLAVLGVILRGTIINVEKITTSTAKRSTFRFALGPAGTLLMMCASEASNLLIGGCGGVLSAILNRIPQPSEGRLNLPKSAPLGGGI